MKTTNKLTDEDIIKAKDILNNKDDYLINRLNEWIEEKKQLSKKEERDRIVEMIEEITGEMRTSETDKIITLITNNK